MHQLVSAIAQLKAATSPWAAVDLSTLTLSEIDSAYINIYLRVSNPFWNKDRTMLFREITQGYSNRGDTLEEFFTAIGTTTLPSIDGLATIATGQIKYADAYWAGYTLSRGNYNQSPSTIPLPDDADSLIMHKPGVDARVFYKNCLVSINGLLHRVDADSDNIYVIDAGKSNYHSRRNEVGIISFKDIGEIECVTITPDMLYRSNDNQPFSNQVYIQSPISNIEKTVGLVMGGYLFLLDNTSFFRTSDDLFCLDIQNIALLDRFYESKDLIDLSSLGIEYGGKSKVQISREQLFSDETITKWLTMSQSFLVYIDNPNLTVERIALDPTLLDKQYLTYKEPTLPMLGGLGMLQPYWTQEDDNVFSITVGDNVTQNRVFNTTPSDMAPMPADNRIPYNLNEYSHALFLNIESEKIVIVDNT